MFKSVGIVQLREHHDRVTRIEDNVSLITDAAETPAQELARRRRRYGIMMAARVVCVVAAVATYQWSLLLALAFVVGGAVLPWCAVLIANDRLPPSSRVVRGTVTIPPTVPLPTSAISGKPTDSRPADKHPTARVIEG